MDEKNVADEGLEHPFLQKEEVRKEIADALEQVFASNNEQQIGAYIQSQWAILARLAHYTDFLVKMNLPEDELNTILNQQLLLTSLSKSVIAKYTHLFAKQPTIPQNISRSPGFIRFLREQCGLLYVMHYIGFSLRAYMKETMGEEHPLFQNEAFFRESMSYLVEMVIDFEEPSELVETMKKQQDEIIWLNEEIELKRNELSLEPENERFKSELLQLEEDYAVEKLEYEFLHVMIEPVF
jgi:hypothetical protein